MNPRIKNYSIMTLHTRMLYLEAITPHFLKHMPSSKLSAIERESGNVEVLWKNIKKCMLDTVSDLDGKVQRKARKP
jgi:precorrin-6B methylase 2